MIVDNIFIPNYYPELYEIAVAMEEMTDESAGQLIKALNGLFFFNENRDIKDLTAKMLFRMYEKHAVDTKEKAERISKQNSIKGKKTLKSESFEEGENPFEEWADN
ncbi:MAG: hypothetical protein IJK60_10040 [Clostridia bacterium]|nr:hypothetical protein [Clostridia bacterium]